MDLLQALSGFRAGEQHLRNEERKSRGSSGEALDFTFLVYPGVWFCSGFGLILFQEFDLPWDSGHYGKVRVK